MLLITPLATSKSKFLDVSLMNINFHVPDHKDTFLLLFFRLSHDEESNKYLISKHN